MAKVYPFQTNFTSGEWSPLLRGRIELAKYNNAMLDAQNLIVMPQGGVTRRGGFQDVRAAETALATRIIPFVFSQDPENSHILEIGCDTGNDQAYINIFDADGHAYQTQILTLVDGTTKLPWGLRSGSYDSDATCQADINNIDYVQVNDIMYFVDGAHDIYKLIRLSGPTWEFRKVNAIGEEWLVSKQMKYRIYTITNDAYGRHTSGHPGTADEQTTLLNQETSGVELIETGNHTAVTYGVGWNSAGNYELTLPQYLNNKIDQGWLLNSQVWGWVFDAEIFVPSSEKYYFAINGESSVDLFVDNLQINPDDSYGLHEVANEGHNEYDPDEFEWFGSAVDPGSTVLAGSVHHHMRVRVINNGLTPIGTDTTYGVVVAWRNGGDLAANDNNTGTDDVRTNDTMVHWKGKEIWEVKIVIEAGATTFKWLTRQQTSVDTDSFDNWVEVATGITAASYVGEGNAYDLNDTVNAGRDLGDIYFATAAGLVAGDEWTLKFGFEAIPVTQFTKYSATSVASYPKHIAFYQDRLALLGFTEEPQRQLFSRPGLYEQFIQGAEADDAFELNVSSKQADPIEGAVETSNGLVIFTAGGIYLTRGSNDEFTPETANSRKKSGRKAGQIRPIYAFNRAIWVDRNEVSLHDLIFDFASDSFTTRDLSILSSHLTANRIKEIAFQRTSYLSDDSEPINVLWVIDDNGLLRSVTYEPDHEVIAWVPHAIVNTTFVSIATVPITTGEEIWALVDVAGTGRRIMYLKKDNDQDSFSGGSSDFTSSFQIMPPDFTSNGNTTQGHKKRFSETFIRLWNTTDITVSNGSRTETISDAATEAVSDKKVHMLGWDTEQALTISKTSAGKMTVLMVFGKMEVTDV